MKKRKDILDHLRPEKINTPDSDFFEAIGTLVIKEYPIAIRKSRSHLSILRISMAAAAILVVGFVLFQQFNMPSIQTSVHESYLAALSPNDILEYIENNIEDYSEDELIEASAPITEEEMESSAFTEVFGYIPEDLEAETIEEYLVEDFINLNDFDENELLIF